MSARPLYPFLFALYLAAAFAAENRAMVIRPLELGRTAALALAVALLGWVLSRLATRDPHRRAGITLLVVLAFGAFRQLRIELSPWLPELLHGALPAFVVWSALLAASALAVARVKPDRSLAGVTRFLNLTSVIALAFPLVSLLGGRGSAQPGPASQPDAELPLDLPLPDAPPLPADAPDIYLIVTDQYTGSELLRENFGYDNRPFERALDSLGFVTPARPRANYMMTTLSLASMLNWTLLDALADSLGRDHRDEEPLHRLIESNRAVRLLRGLGYRFVFVPTSFPATVANRWADVTLEPPALVGARLVDRWLEPTPVGALLEWHCRRTRCKATGFPYEIESADRVEWKFDQLARLARADEQAPRFVFAHLLMPHAPYQFDADCRRREPWWPMGEALLDPETAAAYLAQVGCLNRRLLEVASAIRAHSRRPPVILIQGDHGFGRIVRDRVGRSVLAPAELDPAQVRERLSVFAAYYLPPAPSDPASALVPYDSITPVNLLPLVLNRYLGTAIPLQPDASWWSDNPHVYDFLPVRMSDTPFAAATRPPARSR